MATVTIPFEQREITLPLPDGWKIVETIRPRPHARLSQVSGSLVHALDHPIGNDEPLRERDLGSKRIVLCVDDISRPTPTSEYFGPLLDYLIAHGAQPEKMLILFALGVHRDMTPGEARHKLGDADLRGIRWRNHAHNDERELKHLGTTSRGTYVSLNRHLSEADLIITVGAIEPHLLLGFSGGCKMLIPGLASARTIGENHMQGVSPVKYNYVGIPESPMRLDLEEGARMLGKEIFIVNAVLNESLEICAFFAGDAVKAHREGVEFARSLAERPVDGQADVVIVASNPMNADLRQSMKCVGNVQESVRPNGLIIALAECAHGIGDVTVPPKTLPHGLLRSVLKVIGRKHVLGFIDTFRKDAGIEERFLSHFSAQLTRRNEIFVYSRKLPADTGKKLGIFVQFASIEKMMAAARRKAPKQARVLVYPYGGSTYPRVAGKA
ncbi:MAG TPA: nickel-dependent lactate racemase [Chthoniobacter sp.]|jgi:nickel-dependent lactate racemase